MLWILIGFIFLPYIQLILVCIQSLILLIYKHYHLLRDKNIKVAYFIIFYLKIIILLNF